MQGNLAEIAISLQAAKGTPAATAQHRMRLTGGNLDLMRDVEDIVESTGDVLLDSAFVARVRVEGAPQFIVRPNFIGLLAYGALGAKASDAGPDPFGHTLTLAAAPFALPWLTCWAQLADGRRIRATDCKVVKLRFESSAGGLLVATATIIGRAGVYRDAATWATEVTTVVTAVETANPFIHGDAQGGLLVEGVAVSALERCVLDIDNGGTAQYGDSISPDDVTTARRTIAVETTQIIPDFSLWNRLHFGSATPAAGDAPTRNVLELGGAPAGIQWKYTRPGTPERSIQFAVPRLQVVTLGGLEYNAAGDPIKQAATYRAFKPAAGSGATILVKNGQASYPAL
jgi:hypothetical protein